MHLFSNPAQHLRLQMILRGWVKTLLSISSSSWAVALPVASLVWVGAFGSGKLMKVDLSGPAKISSEEPCERERAVTELKSHLSKSIKLEQRTYLRELIGLLRGFRLQTRTYSLLLTVSRNFTYTLLYIVFASPKYPRYCNAKKKGLHAGRRYRI